MSDAEKAAVKRFARDIADHTMTVLHDDGLYRHLRFQRQVWRPPLVRPMESSSYWFELITAPGSLTFQGDGDAFVFRRVEDMFEFFRGSAWDGRPDVRYWAQKLVSSRKVEQYEQDLLLKFVDESVAEAVKENPALTRLAEDVKQHLVEDLCGDESLDRSVVESFKHWTDPDDEYRFRRKGPNFVFPGIWEESFRDYDWWFLWALNAILWGIGQYDAHKAAAEPAEVPG